MAFMTGQTLQKKKVNTNMKTVQYKISNEIWRGKNKRASDKGQVTYQTHDLGPQRGQKKTSEGMMDPKFLNFMKIIKPKFQRLQAPPNTRQRK